MGASASEVGANARLREWQREGKASGLGPTADLDRHRLRERAVGQLGNADAHGALGTGDDLVSNSAQVVEPVVARNSRQRLRTDPASRDLGSDIAHHLLSEAYIALEDREQLVILLAATIKMHQRDDEAFFKHLLGQAGAFAAADIDMMHGIDRVTDHGAIVKGRCENEDVGGLTVAHPRVVANKDVAGPDGRRREFAHELLAHDRHHAHMASGAEPGLADQIAAIVIETRRHVVHFNHVVREGGAEERGCHLVGGRDQAWPDGIEIEPGHVYSCPVTETSSEPRRSTTTRPPTSITVVAVSSSTRQGPAKRIPDARSSRR